ncbi:hypothetical protein [Gymnodinialimonas hymeniacidonis]|uniref:hypothetical protein n=1 Tax=Gymnodinialimonas hymeniacidonis TaxID=3126508 RepID=UPI0034C69C7D
MRLTLAALLALAASPAFSQATCTEPTGPIETCLVGAWIGGSTIPVALEQAMRSMPDTVRANFNDLGRPVGMVIYDDGFFETFPIGANGVTATRDDDGNVTTFEMAGQTVTTVGYISALGGTLDMCFLPGAQGDLRGEMTVTTSDGSSTTRLFAVPENSFNPVITYTCSGDRMTQTVALPEPLGAIVYDLSRVPDDLFETVMQWTTEDLEGEGGDDGSDATE